MNIIYKLEYKFYWILEGIALYFNWDRVYEICLTEKDRSILRRRGGYNYNRYYYCKKYSRFLVLKNYILYRFFFRTWARLNS